MEEDIIHERVLRAEQPLNRIQKLCMQLLATPEDANLKTLLVDLENYKALMTRINLQIHVNERETQMYTKQQRDNEELNNELSQKTQELMAQLDRAQAEQREKEKLNQLVADMVRPKQMAVPTEEPQQGEPKKQTMIIAQLNTQRSEDVSTIESLEEEIAELEQQYQDYAAAWEVKQAQFRDMMKSLSHYKNVLLDNDSEDDDEEQEQQDEEDQMKD